ncbi:hypothetical protein Efla_001900 [Eimeria flavescens]
MKNKEFHSQNPLIQAAPSTRPNLTGTLGNTDWRKESQTSENADASSCSVSALLRGTSPEQLPVIKTEFARLGGRMDLQQFAELMFTTTSWESVDKNALKLLEGPIKAQPALTQQAMEDSWDAPVASVQRKDEQVAPKQSSSGISSEDLLLRAALIAKAFEAVDIHDEGFVRWESITTYLEKFLTSGRL